MGTLEAIDSESTFTTAPLANSRGDKLHADIQDVIEDAFAPRERLAEEVAPDSSGVIQPTDSGDKLQADIQDVIDDVIEGAPIAKWRF